MAFDQFVQEKAYEKSADRKGKKQMCELYELKPIVPTYFKLEKEGTSENDLKQEDEYDYGKHLAIMMSMYHYYFHNGSAISFSIQRK